MDADISESLLKSGACANVSNALGRTPLHLAAAHGMADCVRLFLLADGDPLVADNSGNLPAALAIQQGHVIATLYFAKYNCPISVGHGRGTAHEASVVASLLEKRHFAVLRVLVASGCIDPKPLFHWLPTQDTATPIGQLDQKVAVDWLREFLHAPPPLLHLARIVIRQALGTKLRTSINVIPLPRQLKDYLLLNDITEDIELEMKLCSATTKPNAQMGMH